MDFLTIFQPFLTPAILLAIVAYPTKLYVEKLIGRSFSRKESEIRDRMVALTDERRHIYDKQLKNFAFYIEKKFTVYNELFEKIQVATGSLSSLVGFRSVPSYETYGEEDLRNYMKEKKFLQSEIERFLEDFRANRRTANEALQKEIYRLDFLDAKNRLVEARNYFILNQLFIADELEENLSKYFELLFSNYVDWEVFIQRNHNIDLDNLRKEEAERNELQEEIKKSMKLELNQSYLNGERI